MKRIDNRLEALERRVLETDNAATVAQISAIMDELSDKAAGGDGRKQPVTLTDILEGPDNAT